VWKCNCNIIQYKHIDNNIQKEKLESKRLNNTVYNMRKRQKYVTVGESKKCNAGVNSGMSQ